MLLNNIYYIIILQDKPTTLVYADVMSFKQKPQSHAGIQVNPPMDDRVEYAQLKDYSENVMSTELTTSNLSDNAISMQSIMCMCMVYNSTVTFCIQY